MAKQTEQSEPKIYSRTFSKMKLFQLSRENPNILTEQKYLNIYLRDLTATTMVHVVPTVLSRNFLRFEKINFFYKRSLENTYVGRSRKISTEKDSKKNIGATCAAHVLRVILFYFPCNFIFRATVFSKRESFEHPHHSKVTNPLNFISKNPKNHDFYWFRREKHNFTIRFKHRKYASIVQL